MFYILMALLFCSNLLAQESTNSVGGHFAAQANAAVARVNDETSPFTNPAGLSKIKKDSISSSASSYSAFKLKEDNVSKITTTSSTSHIAYIKSFETFNFGFMIYTGESSSKLDFDSSYENNSEGYEAYSQQSNLDKTDNNFYIFAIAPKNSNWGVSLNLIDFNLTSESDYATHNYSKLTLSDTAFSNTSMAKEMKVKVVSLSYGYQFAYDSFKFGLKVSSPSYLVSNDSHIYLNSLAVQAFDVSSKTEAYIFNYSTDSKLEPETDNKKFGSENIVLGSSYRHNNFEFELDVSISAAYTSQEFKYDRPLTTASLSTYSGDYANDSTISDSSTSNFHKASIVPSFGIAYELSEEKVLGFGASYTKTSSVDNDGVNTLTITTGYTSHFQNFKGSYALAYRKSMDTGHNTQFNNLTQEDETVDLSSEQLSFIFGGSYSF